MPSCTAASCVAKRSLGSMEMRSAASAWPQAKPPRSTTKSVGGEPELDDAQTSEAARNRRPSVVACPTAFGAERGRSNLAIGPVLLPTVAARTKRCCERSARAAARPICKSSCTLLLIPAATRANGPPYAHPREVPRCGACAAPPILPEGTGVTAQRQAPGVQAAWSDSDDGDPDHWTGAPARRSCLPTRAPLPRLQSQEP